jgi:hypothetical protein
MHTALVKITREWDKAWMEGWVPQFQAMRREAASIPFGTMAVMAGKFVKGKERGALSVERGATELGAGRREMSEGVKGLVFEPQLQALLEAANQRLYGDGLRLSSRIWKTDREARDGVQQVLMAGVADGKSAWQVAQDLEEFLGADEDCPRWTSTRLGALTKKDIASGDRRGLKTGEDCDGQGVAYKALRLARTEIQTVHHMASDRLMAVQPWVEQEQINLSPAHPTDDICDDVIAEGEDGKGIYPKGTIALPLHPHCMCYKTAVLPSEAEFTERLKAWVNGGEDAGMDEYAAFIGATKTEATETDLAAAGTIVEALAVWLWGSEADMLGRLL